MQWKLLSDSGLAKPVIPAEPLNDIGAGTSAILRA